ncbi:MAG: DUF6370 family protein [Planctomycetota bacterium]
MRCLLILSVSVTLLLAIAGCKSGDVRDTESATTTTVSDMTVEVGCASCVYKMEGVQGCKAAAEIDGKPMLLTGAHLSAHSLGLCRGAKEAVVSGKIEGDTFVATSAVVKD